MSVKRADLSKGAFRSDGRLVVSYPKSGRTWVAFALSTSAIDATMTHAGCSTNRREVGRPFTGIHPGLRHVPLVFLHRNPIDTAVSMFHQINGRDFRRGSRKRWLRILPLALRNAVPPTTIDDFVLHRHYGVEKVCAFNSAWLNHIAARPDCMALSYEDLRADPAAKFQELIDFFGVTDVNGADLASAADFAKMRAWEQQQVASQSSPVKMTNADTVKVRRGKVNGYTDELQPDTIRACEAILARYAVLG